MSESTARRGPGFWVALGVGWLVIGYAVVEFLNAAGTDAAIRVGVWVAAGHAAHDLLVAPVILLIGVGVARVVRPRWRAPIHFGLAASAAAVLVAYPALRGFGKNPANPSIQPLDYVSAVLTVLAVIWFIAGVWMLFVRSHSPVASVSDAQPPPSVQLDRNEP